MNYIKAMLAGFVALIPATIIYAVVSIKALVRRYPPPPGGEVGFDLQKIIFSQPSFWVIVLLVFGLAFWWTFRRALAMSACD
jgi:hypothetical protein